ncbi:MAG: MurR/RpiR family transcriptional regulator [Candidatus Pelethousia sp.]|nr:MurR/RpiR family transcriptional regulator [Candidatus Pelethousia sp.]
MILDAMIQQYPKLTKTQGMIIDYITSHKPEVSYSSLKELSEQACVSEVSIINLCRELGFSNFTDMREAIRAEVTEVYKKNSIRLPKAAQSSQKEQEKVNRFCDLLQDNISSSIKNTDMEVMYSCVNILSAAESVYIFGHDASKIAADYMAHRLNFMQLHARSVLLGDEVNVHGVLAQLTKKDCVVFFSFPPYHAPSKEIAEFCRSKGTPVISITDSVESPVVSHGEESLFCKTFTSLFFNTMSAPMAVIELLVFCIAAKAGRRMEEIIEEFNNVSNSINGKK